MEHVSVIELELEVLVWCSWLSLGGPGFASISPEARSQAANHSGDTCGRVAEKSDSWGTLERVRVGFGRFAQPTLFCRCVGPTVLERRPS